MEMTDFDDTMKDRFDLAEDKVRQIAEEETRPYFRRVGEILENIFALSYDKTMDTRGLYADALPEAYPMSFLNPAYAAKVLGLELGRALSLLYRDIIALIPMVLEGKTEYLVLFAELFIEAECDVRFAGADGGGCEDTVPDATEDVLADMRSFYTDNVGIFYTDDRDELVNGNPYIRSIVMESDLSDPAYLSRYGLFLTENEYGLQKYYANRDSAFIEKAADTFVSGYIRGFAVMGKDAAKKKTVAIHYPVGMERIVKRAAELFSERGFTALFSQSPQLSLFRRTFGESGAYATSVNPQMDFDHKNDTALYMDRRFAERTLEVTEAALSERKEAAAVFGGPAVIEVFGLPDFSPVKKPECYSYSDKQAAVISERRTKNTILTNRFIPQDERVFTIISFPLPSIGVDFDRIMDETMRINTLDNAAWQAMQQGIIDVLDRGVRAHIVGKGENNTDLVVSLHPLADPSRETNFENCTADVNIPVGECFTSPVLSGTNGRLYVSHVFISGFEYKDLWFELKDGMAVDYGCSNFPDPADGKRLIYENIMNYHDSLPMGEFAIGTNTDAYRMGRDFHIEGKLPILIAEKTGPHFAFGDTCYSYEEDTVTYNPDGKAIIARSNEISDLRKTSPEKAYFGCHTDITIPFEELSGIWAVTASGEEIPVIEDGLFAVPGTEDLNAPLLALTKK